MDQSKKRVDEDNHSVTLKKGRNGKFRPNWYGDYRTDGARKIVNLGIEYRGTPPASGFGGDLGDELFEASRESAERARALSTRFAAKATSST